MLSFVVSFVKDSRTARLPMNTATDACMFVVNTDPFLWGSFPIKRYVHSFVVVFLFRGNLCLVERKERNVDDNEKDEFVSVVARIEKVDDTNESENREEEKNITRKIESFGGDGFIIIIFFFFSCSSKTSSSKQKRGVVLWRYKRPPNDGRSVLKVDIIITIIIERRFLCFPCGTKPADDCPQELEPIGRERRRRRF